MTIENRDLKPGTRLVARYHKQGYHAEVGEGEDQKLRFKLEDSREFKSISAAGMAITGKSCNGWAFWSVETTETTPAPVAQETVAEATESRAATEETAPTPEKAGLKKRGIFRVPNQKGAPTGKVRWYCHECGESFLLLVGTTPGTCPKGHRVG